MKKRTITALIMAVVLIPILVIEQLLPLIVIVAGFFACVGAYEMIRLYEKEKKYPIVVKVVIILSTLLIYLSGTTIWLDLELQFLVEELPVIINLSSKVGFALLMISIAMQLSLLVFLKDFDAKDIAKSLMSSFYVGFGIACIIALRIMGVRFVLYLFLITLMTDIFAYFFGMLFGKHKMIERISPKKTWEGAIGGTIMGTLISGLFALMYGDLFNDPNYSTIYGVFSGVADLHIAWQVVIIMLVSLITSIWGQIGDLVASRLKRTYDVKDFGNIFPGHGGVLDRFDSTILAAMLLLSAFLLVAVFFPMG
jgi:phosphatidate cytidylyltransferase